MVGAATVMLVQMGWAWAVRCHIQESMRCLWAYIYNIVNK
jgi:hypothetical protein